jgi:hypothetical protein
MGDEIEEDINGHHASGGSVSLSGQGIIIAIGATLNGDNGKAAGRARIFKYNSSKDMWVQMGTNLVGNGL